MENVKRVEIIIDAPEVSSLLEVLRKLNITSHTVFSNLTGAGHRGERRNDEPGGGSGNACVVAAIAPEMLPAVVAAVRPLLKRRGGLCLVTDAQSVPH
jgi:nitrogen regulatory protein PII